MKLYQSLAGRLETQHRSIENILEATERDRLLLRPIPTKWNIHDNIAHLARYQPVFLDRIHQILNNPEPSFGRYIAEEDPEFEHYRMLTLVALMELLDTGRRSIYDLITNLNERELKMIGVHKKFGRLDTVQWTEFFLLHEAHHIFTIFQLAHNTEL